MQLVQCNVNSVRVEQCSVVVVAVAFAVVGVVVAVVSCHCVYCSVVTMW